ncbi:protein PML-like [Hypomesus transpacificus]|uniref:protein PML-like n=1 Tax=Hypomesus transpacificus TaxID=137520 RepID=UPI001F079D37|nr:protein PML-like [Hypomesus transpacificus]
MHSASGLISGDHTIVFFDLETTGLDTAACDIAQLSAISGGRSFNVYTLPRCSFSDGASRVTGLTVLDHTLLLHGRPVHTLPLREALSSFITFLRSFHRPLLTAHNAKRFDCPILARALEECGLRQEFLQVESGFLDTLQMSRELAPGLVRYSQVFLVQVFLGKSYDAHNAIEDVKALQELFHTWRPSEEMVLRFKFPQQKMLHTPNSETLTGAQV